LAILTTVTLASTNKALPDGGVTAPKNKALPDGGVTAPKNKALPDGGVTAPKHVGAVFMLILM